MYIYVCVSIFVFLPSRSTESFFCDLSRNLARSTANQPSSTVCMYICMCVDLQKVSSVICPRVVGAPQRTSHLPLYVCVCYVHDIHAHPHILHSTNTPSGVNIMSLIRSSYHTHTRASTYLTSSSVCMHVCVHMYVCMYVCMCTYMT